MAPMKKRSRLDSDSSDDDTPVRTGRRRTVDDDTGKHRIDGGSSDDEDENEKDDEPVRLAAGWPRCLLALSHTALACRIVCAVSQVVFCEPPLSVRGPKKYYYAVRYVNEIIKVGDAVELRNPGGIPHLGRIVDMFENAKHEPLMTVQWFYRLSDFPADFRSKGPWLPNEVFLSNHRDINPIQSIENKCIVHSDAAPPLLADKVKYVCNRSYVVNSLPIRLEPLTKDQLLDGNRQLQNTYENNTPISVPAAGRSAPSSRIKRGGRTASNESARAGASGNSIGSSSAASTPKDASGFKRKSRNSTEAQEFMERMASVAASPKSSSDSSKAGSDSGKPGSDSGKASSAGSSSAPSKAGSKDAKSAGSASVPANSAASSASASSSVHATNAPIDPEYLTRLRQYKEWQLTNRPVTTPPTARGPDSAAGAAVNAQAEAVAAAARPIYTSGTAEIQCWGCSSAVH